MPNEIFICYSRRDSVFVGKLDASLKKLGINLWIDVSDIPPAVPWRQEVLVGIGAADNFIYSISPDSVASEECDLELNYALTLNKRLIPVVARQTPVNLVRPSIREFNWIFFEDFDKGLKQLISVLDSPLGITFGDRLDAQIEVRVNESSRTFPLYRNCYYLGRSPVGEFSEAGLIKFGDQRTSRHHATLFKDQNKWLLADGKIQFIEGRNVRRYEPSRNGSKVNGRTLKPLEFYELKHEDEVQFSPSASLIYKEIHPLRQAETIALDDERDTYWGKEDEADNTDR